MVTILVSAKPQLPASLYRGIFSLIGREAQYLAEDGLEVCTIIETSSLRIPPGTTHAVRAKILQKHRSAVVATMVPKCHLSDGDFLLFVDADIVNCTDHMFVELVQTCWRKPLHTVAAPLVLLEPANPTSPANRWYDTAGFIHNGKRAALFPPYFASDVFTRANIDPFALPLPLDSEGQPALILNGSVGCVYCANAASFRPSETMPSGFDGEFSPMFTEHYPLCQNAKARGGQIVIRADLVATHAYLPKYGEEFH